MRPVSSILGLLIFFLITSCAVGPDFKTPPMPAIKGYTEKPLPKKTTTANSKGGNAQYFNLGQDIPGDWWALFHSAALDCLVRIGIANSPNLQSAEAALRVAKQNLRVAVGNGLFPAIDAAFSAEQQRFSDNQIGQNGNSIFTLYNATLSLSYNLDVFGGIRRQIESVAARVDFQQFKLQAAYVTLTSNIVTTAITEASLREQISATKELVKAQQQLLELLRKQFQLGAISRVDVLTQESEVAQTMATLPPLETDLSRARHALAALVGSFPSEMHVPEFDLDQLVLPADLPVSIPCNLIRQRPDIRQQEALLHEASAKVGVATANLLPKFTITGTYGFSSENLGDLFSSGSNIWSIMGEVMQPVFHGGALIAERRAAIATFQQIFADYKQTVVTAVQNVADVLRALEMDALELKAQTQAEKAAFETLKITRAQYHLGGANYLNVFIAQRQYQTAKINRIRAQAARYADTAALFQALGGGWWNPIPVEPCCGVAPNAS